MRFGQLIFTTGAALALFGCPGRAGLYSESFEVFGPLEASGRLVWSVAPAHTLVALDPASEGPVAATALPFEPRALTSGAGRVLAMGEAAGGPRLATLDPSAGDLVQVDLPALYDRILPSPDGAYAVLLFDPRIDPAAGDPVVRNANDVTVVDLAAGVATRVALDTESYAPRGVVFSPTGGRAAVVLDAGVVVLDLEKPSRRVSVPLVLDGGGRLTPEEVLFAADGGHLFVRSTGTTDVISLKLEDDGDALAASLNFLFLPGATSLADLALVDGDAGQVAALFQGQPGVSFAAILDADGDQGQTRAIEIEATLWHIVGLGDGLYLLHAAGTLLTSGAAVVGWEPATDRVDVDQLAGAATSQPTVGGNVAFFRNQTGDSGAAAMTAVSVVREATRLRVKQRPLVLSGTLRDRVADPDGGRVLLAVDVDRAGSGAAPDYDDPDDDPRGTTGALVVLEAESLAVAGVVLDDPIRQVGVVGAYYYAVHPDVFGDVTFVPRASLVRDSARRRDGFLLSGLLDAAGED
ncbi:MAG: hypothetical protein KC933_29590 [Myxococcales bacterium]|nr:hypothetical protein [Myxococcales bacterium]